MMRTHSCGELTKKNIGKNIILTGWVSTIRSHGKITFIDLRDRYGITQVVLKELKEPIKDEYILKIKGKVKARPKGTINKNLSTGEIEVEADSLEILNRCPNLPFEIKDQEINEDLRLKYRYLDLRRNSMQRNIITRHKITKVIHDYMDKNGFINVETPFLAKSTPEGARDYLVPSRVNVGKFYALPQSPQLFKQILMVSGLDKYYQIVKCFRDEDLRADRQPEFTQLDIEMSFIDEEDIYKLIEGLMKEIFEKVLNKKIKIPFLRMSYDEAIKKYKSDKPDLRKKKEDFEFCWVVDFLLLEYSKEEGRLVSMHHPFTCPKEEDVKLLDKKPEKAKAKAYDLVLNGCEIGGGSIRISNSELQEKIFDVLKINKKEAESRFGFFLEALKYAPPMGGIALGLDRIAAVLTGNESIREVIAFPKNKAAQCLLTGAPSEVSNQQLKELKLKIEKK